MDGMVGWVVFYRVEGIDKNKESTYLAVNGHLIASEETHGYRTD